MNQTTILPLELLDKCIGSRVWILMKNNKEICGTLCGFDDFMNMVLDDVREIQPGQETIKMESILLHGSQICVMIPGGDPQ